MKPNKKTRQERGGTKNIEKRWIDAAMALPAPLLFSTQLSNKTINALVGRTRCVVVILATTKTNVYKLEEKLTRGR